VSEFFLNKRPHIMISHKNWIDENFKDAELKDKRLSKRLSKITKSMAACPGASLSEQMPNWADLKGAYRFFSNLSVTHRRVQTPHRKKIATLTKDPNSTFLFYQDTSEADYTSHPSTKGVGPIGNHSTAGLMMHNCLAVEVKGKSRKLLGLADQQIWKRKNVSLNRIETRSQRNNRKDKESAVWGKTLRNLKRPPKDCIWVSVGDRGSDIYEYHKEVVKLGWHSVIRANQDRSIKVRGEKDNLRSQMRSLEIMGTTILTGRREKETTAREITLNVAWEAIEMIPPARVGKKDKVIPLWAIRVWNSEEDLEWILLSTLPINNLEDALEKTEWYAGRWLIEEYHKCLKSGCKIESRQLETGDALKTLLGVLSIVAILMLQLRDAAREEPNRPAQDVIPEQALRIICRRFDLKRQDLSTGVFWRSVAKLGGFIGRKSDGDPGWQTLWRGWLRLLDMLFGAELLTVDLGGENEL
jgi:hypothetical protein